MKNQILKSSIAAATVVCASLFVVTTAQAGDSVNVSMPTNNPAVSEYNIALTGQSGKSWTYTVSWVRGKTLSHWDLSLGSCLNSVTSISGGGTKQPDGDPSKASPASGATAGVKSSPLIKWDTTGGTFTVTMDKVYEKTDLPVVAKTATVYNTGVVSGPDCTKEVVAATEPTVPVTEPTVPAANTDSSSNCASKSKAPKSADVSWTDSKGDNGYDIDLVSVSGRTWTYRVTHTSGKALSHWTLGIPACMSKIVSSTSTDGSNAEIGKDASIKDMEFSGIKWNSEGGVYSFTLDNDYAATTVDVLAKAGSLNDGGYSTSTIIGPDCSALATACADNVLSGEQDVVGVHVWKRITAVPMSPEAYQALDKKGVEPGVYAVERIDASGKTVDIEVEIMK
jgi:hypothetical protein